MAETKLFTGGIPYGPDVKRLCEAFPVPALTEGLVIRHGQLEEVLGYKRGTGRYYGVIKSWIGRQQNENSIIVRWEPATGLRVLDPAGVLHRSESQVRQKISQTVRAVKLFAWVDRKRLDENGQKRLDHQVQIVNRVTEALRSAKKDLAVEIAPVKSLPKRALPEAQRSA